MIFVFGSNEGGHHGLGAAKTALEQHGAVMGVFFGHTGNSFAIPTKDKTIRHTLPRWKINEYVTMFLLYAEDNPHLDFQVTRIGCGLAGLKDEDMAPMFRITSSNLHFDQKWFPWLGNKVKYWGTF